MIKLIKYANYAWPFSHECISGTHTGNATYRVTAELLGEIIVHVHDDIFICTAIEENYDGPEDKLRIATGDTDLDAIGALVEKWSEHKASKL